VQHHHLTEPPLPLDASEGVIDGQPLANPPNDAPPRRGGHIFPQAMHDRLAVQLFASERGFANYPRLARYGLMNTIFYDEANDRIFKVIVKSCWSINREYIGRDLWIAFRIEDELYLMPHDEMVGAAEADGFSWKARVTCSRSRLSASMCRQCAPYRIQPEPGEFWLATPRLAFS
jgi:hypothetical protein